MSNKPNNPATTQASSKPAPCAAFNPATDALAIAAVEPITNRMLVGIGAGRSAARGMHALALRIQNEGLNVRCVTSTEDRFEEAKALGLNMIDFAVDEEVDYLIDGADEIDSAMRVIKGSRGAMTRERILCRAAKCTVFMVTEDKIADPQIGTRFPLPIAVMAYGLASTRRLIRHIGLNGVLRRDMDGQLFLTDNGNLVLDATLTGDEDLLDLCDELNSIPGVVDHGLFLDEADEILVEKNDGAIERFTR